MSIKSEVQRIKNGKILLKDEFAENDVFIPNDVLINRYYEYLEYLKSYKIKNCDNLFINGIRTDELPDIYSILKPTTAVKMFNGCVGQNIDLDLLISSLDFSDCVNMARTFEYFRPVDSEGNEQLTFNLNGINTNNCENLSYLLFNSHFTTIDLGTLDTKKAKDMYGIVSGSGQRCNTLLNFSCENGESSSGSAMFSSSVRNLTLKPNTGLGTSSLAESITINFGSLLYISKESYYSICDNVLPNTTGLQRIVTFSMNLRNTLTEEEKLYLVNKGYEVLWV